MKTKATLSERLGYALDSANNVVTQADVAFDKIRELEEEVEDQLEIYMTQIHERVNDPDITYSAERIKMEIEQADSQTRESINYYAGCISILTGVAQTLGMDAQDYEQYYEMFTED